MVIALSIAAGFVAGGVVSGGILGMLLRARRCPNPDDHELREEEREQLASEFAAHAASVRRELGRYADALADGDVNLRQRLRHIEAGVSS